MIDPKLLECFIAVAECLHFRKAAERLFISQPALTQQIKRLEALIRAPLFDRNTRSVFLTPAGDALLRKTRHLQAETEEIIRHVQSIAKGEGGFLRIGFTPTAACSSLTEAIYRFTSSTANIEIGLQEMNSIDMFAALRQRKFDVAFMRPIGIEQDILMETLYQEPLLYCSRSDRISRGMQSITIEQVVEQPLIEYDSRISPYFNSLLSRIFFESGLQPKYSHRSIIPTILSYVEMGLGGAIIPASLMRAHNGSLSYVPIADIAHTAETSIAHLKRCENGLISDLKASYKDFDFSKFWRDLI